MKKLNIKIQKPSTSGIFHDTRADAKIIRDVLNKMLDKIDELVEEVNKLKSQQ